MGNEEHWHMTIFTQKQIFAILEFQWNFDSRGRQQTLVKILGFLNLMVYQIKHILSLEHSLQKYKKLPVKYGSKLDW